MGYVSLPLIQELIKREHFVTVISSNPGKKVAIEALGARAAIGMMEDVNFLTDTFTGADAVYCMLDPYGNFGDPDNDASAVIKRADTVINNYKQAIESSGVKRLVYLSSIGADMQKGAGLIIIHHNAEHTLRAITSEVDISFVRPSGFYKNLFAFVNSIKNQNLITATYGGNDVNVFVSNLDIAHAIVEELESKEAGIKVRYVASDELTCNQAAKILGSAIGIDLKWVAIGNDEQLEQYKSYGMNESLARQFVEMNASIHSGKFFEDYNRNKPIFGNVKMEDFAQEFAVIYHNQ